MDLRQLLGKLTLIEGSMQAAEKHPTGPKFTGQWKGTDKGTPGTKLVGDSVEPEENILKDLSKGPKPKSKEKELAEQFEAFMQALEEENLGVAEKRPLRKGSRPARDYGKEGEPSKRYTQVDEHGDQEGYEPWGSQDLEPGQKAIQGKPVKDTKKFTKDLAKDLGKELSKSLKEDESEQQDFLYKVVCDGYDKGNFVNKNDAIFSGQYMIYYGEKEYHKIQVIELATGNVIWEWTGEKHTEAPPTESPPSKVSKEQAHYEDVGTGKERCGNCKFFGEPNRCSKVEGEISPAGICDLYSPANEEVDEAHGPYGVKSPSDIAKIEKALEREKNRKDTGLYRKEKPAHRKANIQRNIDFAKTVDEAKTVPVITAFRKGMEKIANSGMSPQAKQEAFDKLSAEFHRNAQAYSDAVKANRKVDEAGANNPVQGTANQTVAQQDPKQIAATNQALQTMKAGTQSSAPTTLIAKALDAASQGKPVGQADMKALEPMMKDLTTVAQDPKLASQFKTLAQQVQQKQQQQKP